METRYYFEFDCFTLNRKARLHYPLNRRITDTFKNIIYRSNSHALLGPEGLAIEKLGQKIKNVESKIDWDQNLQNTTYVVFDCETTGLQPFKGDRIISIGGIKIENEKISPAETFEVLVNPERPIPRTARDITGISDEMVADAMNVYEALLKFFDFAGSSILVAHNAAFDLTFLNIALCRLAPLRVPHPVIDTYILARSIFPDMFEYSLERLCKKLDIPIKGRHTAIGDARVTAELYLDLLERLGSKRIHTLQQLRGYMEWYKNNEKLHKPLSGGL